MELEERVAFGDERGVVKAVCDLGLVKYLHGVYASIAVASDLGMEWKGCSYLEDTTEASLSQELNECEVLKRERRMVVGLGGFEGSGGRSVDWV